MKKLFVFCLTLLAALSLWACGKASTTVETEGGTKTYDKNGNLVEEKMIDVDGTYLGRREYTYEDGLLATETEFDSAGGKILTSVYTYTAEGVLSHCTENFYSGDSISGRNVMEYNPAGLVIRSSYYDGTNTLISVNMYTYDGSDQKTGTHYYAYENGVLKTSMVFDKDQNMIGEYSYDESGQISWSVVYEFIGKLPHKGTNSDGSYMIYHYDENDVCTGYTCYEADGTFRYEETYG